METRELLKNIKDKRTPPVEKFLIRLLNKAEKYSNYGSDYYYYLNKVYFEIDYDSGIVWFNYEEVWDITEKIFNYKMLEIRHVLHDYLLKHMKINIPYKQIDTVCYDNPPWISVLRELNI